MKFSQLIKSVDGMKYSEINLNPGKIKAQYNPDRFNCWLRVTSNDKDPLNMIYSPHVRFLKRYIINPDINFIDTSYYAMHKLYGKKDKWIFDKIEKFISLYKDIKQNGIKDNIVILNKPLVKNKYNSSYEIFEGHHRIACTIVLKLDSIKCNLVEIV